MAFKREKDYQKSSQKGFLEGVSSKGLERGQYDPLGVHPGFVRPRKKA